MECGNIVLRCSPLKRALGVLAVTNEELENYIERYNSRAFDVNQLSERKLSDDVVLAKIWKYPPTEPQDSQASDRFFIIIHEKRAIGIVFDMGVHNIHWFMKPEWRKQGKLSSALKTTVFPYLFHADDYEFIETEFNSERNETYLTKLGFVPSKTVGKLILNREKVTNSMIESQFNTLSTETIESMRKELSVAANILSSVADKLLFCGEVELASHILDQAEDLNDELSQEILNLG